jgi:hypothetical protein
LDVDENWINKTFPTISIPPAKSVAALPVVVAGTIVPKTIATTIASSPTIAAVIATTVHLIITAGALAIIIGLEIRERVAARRT